MVDSLRETEPTVAGEFGTWVMTNDERGTKYWTASKTPGYESGSSLLQEEDKLVGRRRPFHQRISGFYKPTKQYPGTQELKHNASLGRSKSRTQSHHKAASLGVNVGYPVSIIDNVKGTPVSALAVSGHARRPSHPFALPSGWIKRVATPTRDTISPFISSSTSTVSNPPVPPVESSFTTSVSVAEGMLHPNTSTKVQFKGSTYSCTYRENRVSHNEDVSGESRFSSLSSRSKTPSITRPLSGLFNKSTDVLTDGSWSQRPLAKLSRSWSSSPTAHSRDGSFYFESNREHAIIPVKTKSWAKILNGYVSPRSRSRADGTRRRKSIRQVDFDLSINPRKRGRSVREVASPILLAQGRRQSSGNQPSNAIHRSTGTMPTPKTSAASRCNPKSLLCAVLLHMLLFWICPPNQAIALGGYGMLVVYGMLALGLVCVSWMFFEGEVLVTSLEENAHQS